MTILLMELAPNRSGRMMLMAHKNCHAFRAKVPVVRAGEVVLLSGP
jgi:hypothetical protein